jgi:uncharacterized protein YecT (DUF1311 family)
MLKPSITFLLFALCLTACGSYISSSRAEITPAPIASPTVAVINCNRTAITQFDLNQCAAQQVLDSQQRLDQLLIELKDKFSGDSGKELQAIQQNWQTFRDRSCTWQKSLFENGSLAPMEYSQCIASYNNQRIEELAILLCDGVGLTGPCAESQKYVTPTAKP